MRHEVKLVGGPYDGGTYTAFGRQPFAYIQKKLTKAELDALNIDGGISWKLPDAVYDRVDGTTFKYRHTVHYKPRDGGQIEIEPKTPIPQPGN